MSSSHPTLFSEQSILDLQSDVGFFERTKKPIPLNPESLKRQSELMNSSIVHSAFKLLNSGILYSQIKVEHEGKQMKETLKRFVMKYFVPICEKAPQYLVSYGYVPIAFRIERERVAKDFKELYPLVDNTETKFLVPYIPNMQSIIIETTNNKGHIEYSVRFRGQKHPSPRLKLYFGSRIPDFDSVNNVVLSDLYKIYPTFQQMSSVNAHLMSNISKNVNPGIMIQQKPLNNEESRLRSRDTDHMFPFEHFLKETTQKDTDVVNLPSSLEQNEIFRRTNTGDIIGNAEQVTVLKDDHQLVTGTPRSEFPFSNNLEFARNWMIIDICATLGVPPNYFVISHNKNITNVHQDRTKLLESRQNLVHEMKSIVEAIWLDILQEEVNFKIDILPAATPEDILRYLALGLLDPHSQDVIDTFYHLSGVRVGSFGVETELSNRIKDAYGTDLKIKKLDPQEVTNTIAHEEQSKKQKVGDYKDE